jgi:polysaccharide biosynthesis protein PslH
VSFRQVPYSPLSAVVFSAVRRSAGPRKTYRLRLKAAAADAATAPHRMRVLFVTPRPPWPTRRGDQARAATLIAGLATRHAIRVVTLRPPGFAPCRFPAGIDGIEVGFSWPAGLAAALAHPRLPLQVGLHHSPRLLAALRDAVATFRPDAAVVVLSRIGTVLDALGTVPAVVDLVDSLHLNLQNRAARQRFARRLFRWEAQRIGAFDRALARRAAHATVVSQRDLADLAAGDPGLERCVTVLPCAVAVPAALPPIRRGGNVVLLQGNLGYFPTVDGALWFAREVWPILRRLFPGVEWRLAGARPTRAIRALGGLPGIKVVANPDDLAEELRCAAVVVAPLLAGSGTPNKVLEAMAAGGPVVTTPAGAAGLDGVAAGDLAVAADNWQVAQSIAHLLIDRDAAARQAAAAWHYVSRVHALEVVSRALEDILARITAR